VAINWCICKGAIPIPGVKTVRHVEENLGALGWRLSPAEMSELESAAMAAPKKMIQNVFSDCLIMHRDMNESQYQTSQNHVQIRSSETLSPLNSEMLLCIFLQGSSD